VTTFAELGIPFPLFRAPTQDAESYAGIGACNICGERQAHRFRLYGGFIVAPCPSCGQDGALEASEQIDGACHVCGRTLSFPSIASKSNAPLHTCYRCLRKQRAGFAIQTIVGYVGWEQAVAGLTGSIPETLTEGAMERLTDSTQGFERVLVATDTEEFSELPRRWYSYRVSPDDLFELLRTPPYRTNQGEIWLFCCRRPMIYLGAWTQDDFAAHAADGNGRALFDAIVPDSDDALWRGGIYDYQGIYVFRCQVCGRLDAHWDNA
jgi:uncharacterized protein UPF0167